MTYKYDIHVHCKEGSPCGKDSAADIVRAYAKAGYAGIVLTDHFTPLTPELHGGYRAGVENQYHAYLIAKDEGEKCGLDVFFGFEFRYEVHDFLTYGVGKDFLLENDDLFSLSFPEYANRIHAAGGYVVQAHPFRYVKNHPICIQVPFIDAVEIYNGSHLPTTPYPPFYNDLAEHFAREMHLIGTAGSDTHDVNKTDGIPLRKAGMLFPEKLRDVHHMISMIRSGSFEIWK